MLQCGYHILGYTGWNYQRFRLAFPQLEFNIRAMFNLAKSPVICCSWFNLHGKLQLCQSDGWSWQHLEDSFHHEGTSDFYRMGYDGLEPRDL